MIEILSSAALATVQDLGRVGSLRWGVGTSGAMDTLALAAGNLLLGNDADAAAIEVPVFPFKLRFDEDCAFALTGADCAAQLDERRCCPGGRTRRAPARCSPWACRRAAAWRGSRAVLCLAGGVDVPEVLGSRSTQLRGAFGGHEGRALRKGDVLRAVRAGQRAADRLRPGAAGAGPAAAGRRRAPRCACCPRPNTWASRKPRARRSGPANGRSRRRATATAIGSPATPLRPSRRWRCARTASCPA